MSQVGGTAPAKAWGQNKPDVRNSKEASVPAAGSKARKAEGPDNSGTLWPMASKQSFYSELEVLSWSGRRQGLCSPRQQTKLTLLEETTLMAVVCSPA